MSNKRPNILIVMTDQQRADYRKSRGYALDTMPFLDSFGKDGVDFNLAYTPNPTCMPARVSLFTGRYPSCHHVRTNHNAMDATYSADLLDVMKGLGYRTALCGKNHSHHEDVDFDFHETCMHTGYQKDLLKTEDEKAFDDFMENTQHMEIHHPSPFGGEMPYPDRKVSSTVRFIDECEGAPFFAWVSFAEPHNPFQVPEPYFNMFPPESLPEIRTGKKDTQHKGEKWQWLREQWEEVLVPDYDQRVLRARSNYLGMLRLIDDQFRRLITGLEERNLRENTLVIFLSDHGDFGGEYGLLRKGPELPEVLTRIPLVIQGPGIGKQGVLDHACVNIVDILPTICDYLSVETPLGVQGKSILPLLQMGTYPAHEYDIAYSESGFSGLYWNHEDGLTPYDEGARNPYCTFDCLDTWTQSGQVRMVRKGDWKIQVDMMGSTYLYNLKSDPLETINLAGRKEYTAVMTEMLTELAAAMMKACDPLPVPHFRYRTKLHPKGFWHDEAWHCEDMGVRKEPPMRAYSSHSSEKTKS